MRSSPSLQPGLYPRLLGASWYDLAPAIQRAHTSGTVGRAAGVFRIRHGSGGLAGWLVRAARLPPPAEAVEARLVVCRRGSAESWHRTFGDTIVVTSQRAGPDGLLAERLGLLEFRFRLAVADGALIYRQTGLMLRLGPLRFPLPGRLSPQVTAREEPAARTGEMHVSVEVHTPAGALLFSYEGDVRPEGATA